LGGRLKVNILRPWAERLLDAGSRVVQKGQLYVIALALDRCPIRLGRGDFCRFQITERRLGRLLNTRKTSLHRFNASGSRSAANEKKLRIPGSLPTGADSIRR